MILRSHPHHAQENKSNLKKSHVLRGASSPANPALKMLEPWSNTKPWTSSLIHKTIRSFVNNSARTWVWQFINNANWVAGLKSVVTQLDRQACFLIPIIEIHDLFVLHYSVKCQLHLIAVQRQLIVPPTRLVSVNAARQCWGFSYSIWTTRSAVRFDKCSCRSSSMRS